MEDTHFFLFIFIHFFIEQNVEHVLHPGICGKGRLELRRQNKPLKKGCFDTMLRK